MRGGGREGSELLWIDKCKRRTEGEKVSERERARETKTRIALIR